MTVTSTSSNIYNQYQNLISGLKSGSVSYDQALQETKDLSSQTRGYIGATAQRYFEKATLPPELMERIQNSIAKMAPYLAAQAYANSQPASTEASSAAASSGVSLKTIIGPALMNDARSQMNQSGYDYLSDYAQANKQEWMAAADQLNINANGPSYIEHFYRVPDASAEDINLDAPSSEAERIFREIASPEDIAEFDSLMAPQKQEIESALKEKVLGMLEQTSIRMEGFAPHLAKLEVAGITPDDMSRVLVSRDQSGNFNVEGRSDKTSEIADLINNDPDLRAYYNSQADKHALPRVATASIIT